MKAEDRLIKYVCVPTMSDPESSTSPSTSKQLVLGKMLVEELKEVGITDAYMDEYGYVYGHLPSNIEKDVKTVGFVAHMDTAPDYNDEGAKPRIIRNYDGKDIELSPGVVTKISDFPHMVELQGRDIMVTDGNTLLGADDKGGIVAIMQALEYYHEHPEVKHGKVSIAFTPDEEIGRGTEHFDLKAFSADFGYTMDGGEIKYYCDETFNAASAVVIVHGFSIHPGSAKNKMINAQNVAMEFHAMLPSYMRPEHTENREGFIHLTDMSGSCNDAKLEYIIRDHDAKKLEDKMHLMERAAKWINDLYGENTLELKLVKGYRNMKEVISAHPEVSNIAWSALEELGIKPELESCRGGTDGANLSFMGLPCPNLGTGAGNMHGRYEYCDLYELEKSSELIRIIIRKVMEE